MADKPQYRSKVEKRRAQEKERADRVEEQRQKREAIKAEKEARQYLLQEAKKLGPDAFKAEKIRQQQEAKDQRREARERLVTEKREKADAALQAIEDQKAEQKRLRDEREEREELERNPETLSTAAEFAAEARDTTEVLGFGSFIFSGPYTAKKNQPVVRRAYIRHQQFHGTREDKIGKWKYRLFGGMYGKWIAIRVMSALFLTPIVFGAFALMFYTQDIPGVKWWLAGMIGALPTAFLSWMIPGMMSLREQFNTAYGNLFVYQAGSDDPTHTALKFTQPVIRLVKVDAPHAHEYYGGQAGMANFEQGDIHIEAPPDVDISEYHPLSEMLSWPPAVANWHGTSANAFYLKNEAAAKAGRIMGGQTVRGLGKFIKDNAPWFITGGCLMIWLFLASG